jgi:tetratricopeptide (TPR) repeat protein
MGDGHLGHEFFSSLMEGNLDKDEVIRRLRDHLLDACPSCRSAFQKAIAGQTPGSVPAVPSLEKTATVSVDWEAGQLVDLASAVAPEERLAFLSQRSLSPAAFGQLIWALCQRGHQGEPEVALEWALLAEQLCLQAPAPRPAHRVLALAFQGNAWRRQAKIPEARVTMDQAWRLLRQEAVEDAEITAELLSLTASLDIASDRYTEAAALLERAEELYGGLGQAEAQARVMVKLGIVHDFLDRPEMAYEVTYRAIHLFRPWENPRLYVCGFCNMARYLCSQGKFEDALEVATVDEAMVEEMDSATQANYQWLLARIHEGRGDDRLAERHYRRARSAFVEMGHGFDTAILSLHLASLCYRNYRREEALELASQSLHLAQAHGLHPEAQAALALLTQTLQSRAAAGLILAEATRFLEEVRQNPEAKFEPPKS